MGENEEPAFSEGCLMHLTRGDVPERLRPHCLRVCHDSFLQLQA